MDILWKYWALQSAERWMDVFARSTDIYVKGCAHYLLEQYTKELTGKSVHQILEEMAKQDAQKGGRHE